MGKTLAAHRVTLSQGFYSSGSAVITLGAATTLTPKSFTAFSVLLLAQTSVIGLLRSAIYYPSLVERRFEDFNQLPRALPPAGIILGAALQYAFSYAYLRDGSAAAMIAIASTPAFAYDGFRHSCIMDARHTALVIADSTRLLICFSSFFILSASVDAPASFAIISVLTSAAFGPLIALRRGGRHVPVDRKFGLQSLSQSAEYLIGQALVVAPVLTIAAVTQDTDIGGYRLAQALTGPMNLLFSAVNLRQLTERSTRDPDPIVQAKESLKLARRYAIAMGTIAAGLMLLLLAASPAIAKLASAVDERSFTISVIAFGLFMVGGGVAGPYIIAMRSVRRSSRVVGGRAVMLVAVALIYSVQFLQSRDSLSALLLGTAAAGVLYPLCFILPATRIIKKKKKKKNAMGEANHV